MKYKKLIYQFALTGLLFLVTVSLQVGLADEEKGTLLTSAKAALDDRFFEVAEDYLKSYIERENNEAKKANATVFLAQALHGQNKYGDVVKMLTRRVGWAKDAPTKEGFKFWKAMSLNAQKKYEDAMEIVDATPFDPEGAYFGMVVRLKVRCLVSLEKGDEAVVLLNQFDRSTGDQLNDAPALLDWAAVLIQLERHEAAEVILQRLVKSFPEERETLQGKLWLAEVQVHLQKWKSAEKIYNQLVANDTLPKDRLAEGLVGLARIQVAQEAFGAAGKSMQKAVNLSPTHPSADQWKVTQAEMKIRDNQVDAGILAYRTCVQAKENTEAAGQILLELASLLEEEGHVDLALKTYQEFLEVFNHKEGVVLAHIGKARLLLQMKKYTEASTALEKAVPLLEREEDIQQNRFVLGNVYMEQGRYEEAFQSYTVAVEKNPTSTWGVQALLNAGNCLARQGRYDEAMGLLQEVANEEGSPEKREQALLQMARHYEEQEMWSEAMGVYSGFMKANETSTQFSFAVLRRALLRYRIGDFALALKDFERVTEKFDDSIEAEQAYYMRGWCKYLLGQSEAALEINQSFLEKHPESQWVPEVRYWLAEFYYNRTSFEEAEREFLRISDDHADSGIAEDALYWAARSAMQRDDLERAVELFRQIPLQYPDSKVLPRTRFSQGDVLAQMGRYDGAILLFDKLITEHPDSDLLTFAWGRKADCQFALGVRDERRYREAVASYKTLLGLLTDNSELRYQTLFKLGKSWERLEDMDEAFRHYTRVLYDFLAGTEAHRPDESIWFTRAAFSAAKIQEERRHWEEAINIYKRVTESGLPSSVEAARKIEKIKEEHALVF